MAQYFMPLGKSAIKNEIFKIDHMQFYSHEEMLDKHIGTKDNAARDTFDADVEAALIGDTLREARKALNLTQSQLGEREIL